MNIFVVICAATTDVLLCQVHRESHLNDCFQAARLPLPLFIKFAAVEEVPSSNLLMQLNVRGF